MSNQTTWVMNVPVISIRPSSTSANGNTVPTMVVRS